MSGFETGKLEDPWESIRWWEERRLPWGHIHVHLLFPTYEVTTKDGRKLKVIDKCRLTSLDDTEVIEYAKKFGNPEDLLHEDWIPAIPGINMADDYSVYAKDPVPWIEGELNGEFNGL